MSTCAGLTGGYKGKNSLVPALRNLVVNSRRQNKHIYTCIKQLSNGPEVPKQQPSGIWLVWMTCIRSSGQKKTMSPEGLFSLAASGLSCHMRDLTLQCMGFFLAVAR